MTDDTKRALESIQHHGKVCEGEGMKQYCRYCAYMCVTDTHGCYCEKNEKFKSESFAKHTNTCPDFTFCEMDAFMENPNAYKPRRDKTPEEIMLKKNQVSFL